MSKILSTASEDASAGADAYAAKSQQYFAGARHDWIEQLPASSTARILEIGCGNGDMGAAAKSSRKCAFYAGVDIHAPAAEEAAKKIDQVTIGDIERIKMPWQPESFDVLLMSEVLEHLVDPWSVLCRLRSVLKPQAVVFASSPNIAHWSTLWMLIQGEWMLDNKGIMDRTHLRWFTPQSYRRMFENCGYIVDDVGPVRALGAKGSLGCFLTFGRAEHLLFRQVNLKAHVAAAAEAHR